jgi:hypothetical protein
MASIKGPFLDSDNDQIPDTIDHCPTTVNPRVDTNVVYSGNWTWLNPQNDTIGTYSLEGSYYYNDTVSCVLRVLNFNETNALSFINPESHFGCSSLTRHDTTIVVCQPYTWSYTGRTYSQSEEDSIRINCDLWYLHLVIGTPVATAGIQGSGNVCKNSSVTYTLPAVAGASSYQWTLPPLASGSSTTNSITVRFPSNYSGGVLSVRPVNQCGVGSAVSLPVIAVTSTPTGRMFISGPVAPAVSGTYSVNTIAGADTYSWSVSNGAATIISGQGTASIELQVQPGYTGTIVLQVVASNCKGNGSRATKSIVVRTPARSQDPLVQFQEQKLMVYPNPNSGAFTVRTVPFDTDAKLEMYSMDGRLVLSVVVPAHTTEMPLELNRPAAGLYQVRVVAGEEVRAVKVVVD